MSWQEIAAMQAERDRLFTEMGATYETMRYGKVSPDQHGGLLRQYRQLQRRYDSLTDRIRDAILDPAR